MPRLSIRTVMLDELAAHHRSVQEQRLRKHVAEAVSDLSDSDLSASDLSMLSLFSPISIDTPDIMISSDISMHSGHSSAASIGSAVSNESVVDFELEYFHNWRRRYYELRTQISTVRVLQRAPPVPKSSQLHLLDHWRVHSPERFRHKLRVEPQTFDSLVELIVNNPVFYNHSNCPQLPAHLQLCIFLFHAGHYGNASSPEDAAQWAGISVGGVEKCTDRVVVALLSHHDDTIHFPEADEKEDAKDYVEEHTCLEWRNGFLLVDGTKFLFFQRPGLHGDTWFNKDGEYSIDCQVCHEISFVYQRIYSFTHIYSFSLSRCLTIS
jgi:hypothetical protein